MILYTQNINKAAFFTTLGAKLISITQKYPENIFVIDVRPWMTWYEVVGFVPYKKFCNQRIRLKDLGRTQAGLPKRFTGRSSGFKFGDIARFSGVDKG